MNRDINPTPDEMVKQIREWATNNKATLCDELWYDEPSSTHMARYTLMESSEPVRFEPCGIGMLIPAYAARPYKYVRTEGSYRKALSSMYYWTRWLDFEGWAISPIGLGVINGGPIIPGPVLYRVNDYE